MPQNAGDRSDAATCGIGTSAAMNAKIGRMIAFTHGSMAWRTTSAGPCAIASPSSTPAIVACTPEASTSTQVVIARITSITRDQNARARVSSIAAEDRECDDRQQRERQHPDVDVGREQHRDEHDADDVVEDREGQQEHPHGGGQAPAETASTPSAKAMSVAVGTGHPDSTPLPAVIAR